MSLYVMSMRVIVRDALCDIMWQLDMNVPAFRNIPTLMYTKYICGHSLKTTTHKNDTKLLLLLFPLPARLLLVFMVFSQVLLIGC